MQVQEDVLPSLKQLVCCSSVMFYEESVSWAERSPYSILQGMR